MNEINTISEPVQRQADGHHRTTFKEHLAKEFLAKQKTTSDLDTWVKAWDVCTTENVERVNYMIQKLIEEEAKSQTSYTSEITILQQMAFEIQNLGEKFV